jgi:hypothetical protein
MSNSSKLWNGEVSKWPGFVTDVQMALKREKCGSIIIPFGSTGHVAAIVDRAFPPMQYLAPNGDLLYTQRAVFDSHIESCRKNAEENQKYEEKCGVGLATIYGMLGPDAIRKIKHIRDDEIVSDRQKAEWIMPALEAAFVGHTAAVRTEIKSGMSELAEITSTEAALTAIETIDDANRLLARHINPANGQANYFQDNDADKIDKFLNLLQGGSGSLFYDAKLHLVRARDSAGGLTWAALVREIERVCDNVRTEGLKESAKRSVSKVHQEKSYADGLEDGRKAAAAEQRNSRDRGGRERERSTYRYGSRDNSRERGGGRDDYRSRRESSADKQSDGRDGGNFRYGRHDGGEKRDRTRDREYSQGRDSHYRRRDNSQDSRRYGDRYRDERARDVRDRDRERPSAGKESEGERIERLVADGIKKALASGGRSKN